MSFYRKYLEKLVLLGCNEIEHSGHDIRFDTQRERFTDVINMIHDYGLEATLYTGVFGTENIFKNNEYVKFAQRNVKGEILSYGGVGSSFAMMCPDSNYAKEIVVPRIEKVLSYGDFDNIFIDIPWIMKGGCYCDNCNESRQNGESNQSIVRRGLKEFVRDLKKIKQKLNISVNSSMPIINQDFFTGAHISNLTGIFDGYSTEWNPYRGNTTFELFNKSLVLAKNIVRESSLDVKLYHVTTLTNREGKIYNQNKITNLIYNIIKNDFKPHFTTRFPLEQLNVIGDAYKSALDMNNNK